MIVQEIKIESLITSDDNRDIGDVTGLAESMAEIGQLHPIIVNPAKKSGFYRVVAGHRRLAAASILGWREISALVTTDKREHLIRAAENLARKDLTLAEKATTLHNLAQHIPMEDVARSLGVTKSYVRRLVQLRTDLVPDVWAALVAEGAAARIGQWLKIVCLNPAEQRREVFGSLERKTIERPQKSRKRVRKRAAILLQIQALPDGNPYKDVLRWVLLEAPWPSL